MREVGAVLAAVEPAGPGIADLEAAANVSELGRDGPEKGRGGPDEDLPGGRIGAPRSHGALAAKGLERAVFQGPSRGWLRGAGGLLLPPPDLTRRMAETIEVSTRALSA